MAAAALDPHTEAIAPDGPAHDLHPVHPAGKHPDADVARGYRVPALQRDPGEVEPGQRAGDDDDPMLGPVRKAIAAGTDLHVALDLGSGLADAQARIAAPTEAQRGEQEEKQRGGGGGSHQRP